MADQVAILQARLAQQQALLTEAGVATGKVVSSLQTSSQQGQVILNPSNT